MSDLWAAVALLMVFEGILPFLNPEAMRRNMRALCDLDDQTLRVIGFASMMAGLLLLYLVRANVSPT